MTDESKSDIRNCSNCACYHEQTSALMAMQKQGFCRRDPPTAAQARVDVPRLDRMKNPVIGKDGKPIMESVQQLVYLYKPTLPELVCFDGWRPMSCKPGERIASDMDGLVQALRRLKDEMLLGDAPVVPLYEGDLESDLDDFPAVDSPPAID